MNKLKSLILAAGIITATAESQPYCWCALGAIHRCYRQSNEGLSKAREIACRLEQAAPVQRFDGIVAHWNDAATYEEVVGLLKELDI